MQPALAAIDKKDAQALFEAGDKIDEVCESCHQVFWYPEPSGSGIAGIGPGSLTALRS